MKSNILFILGVAFLLAIPSFVQALDFTPIQNFANNAGLSPFSDFQTLLLKILDALLAVSFILAVIFIVLSGYRMITSAGEPEKLTAAKKHLLWAIIGLVVIVLAYAILSLIVEIVRTGKAGNIQ